MKEIVFATVLNDAYVKGLVAFIKSVKHHNPNFNYRFVVFHASFLPIWGELSAKSVELLDSLYDNFDFVEPNFKNYLNNGREDLKYLSLESFNLKADKVIFLDADILCLGDLKELIEFEPENGIAMVHCKHNREYYVGVMVVGKKYLNHETYEDILKFDDSQSKKFGVDMKLLNTYFEGKIEPLPDEFDAVCTEVQKREGKLVISSLYPLWEKMRKEKVSLDIAELNEEVFVEWKKSCSPGYTSYRGSAKFLKEVKILHYIHSPWHDLGLGNLRRLKIGEDLIKLWNGYYHDV
jgi:lipopolysaccharide biosynthesis glycosyltransferase